MSRRVGVVVAAFVLVLAAGIFPTWLTRAWVERDRLYCANNLRELAQFVPPSALPEAQAKALEWDIPPGTVPNLDLPPGRRPSWVAHVLPNLDQRRQDTASLARPEDVGRHPRGHHTRRVTGSSHGRALGPHPDRSPGFAARSRPTRRPPPGPRAGRHPPPVAGGPGDVRAGPHPAARRPLLEGGVRGRPAAGGQLRGRPAPAPPAGHPAGAAVAPPAHDGPGGGGR